MNSACPACQLRRLHTAEERAAYHPLAGHGYQSGQGWSSEAARLAHDDDVAQVILKPEVLKP